MDKTKKKKVRSSKREGNANLKLLDDGGKEEEKESTSTVQCVEKKKNAASFWGIK